MFLPHAALTLTVLLKETGVIVLAAKDTLVLHQIVGPNVSRTRIAHQTKPVANLNVELFVEQECALQQPNAQPRITLLYVLVRRELLEIHSIVASTYHHHHLNVKILVILAHVDRELTAVMLAESEVVNVLKCTSATRTLVVDPNASATTIVPARKLVKTTNALTHALVFAVTTHNVKFVSTFQFALALLVTKVIPSQLVTAFQNLHQSQLGNKILVCHLHADHTAKLEMLEIPVNARVLRGTLDHLQTVDQNVQSTQNVHRTKPVLNLSALIPVSRTHVLQTLSVGYATIRLFARAPQVMKAIHSSDAILLSKKLFVKNAIHVNPLRVARMRFAHVSGIGPVVPVSLTIKALLHSVGLNVLSILIAQVTWLVVK